MKFLKYISAFFLISASLISCDNTDTDEPTIDPAVHLVRVKVKVLDYSPAPGQFVNELPKTAAGESKEQVLAKVEAIFNGTNDAAVVTLGSFGGSVTFRTAEPVTGKFQIIGNAIPTQGEPGIVSISADGSKWYNLAGQNFSQAKPVTVTYHQPAQEATDEQYIRWEANDGTSGWLSRIPEFHTQNYFPEWNNLPTLTFTALRLPDNGFLNPSTLQWNLTPLTGYADCFPNSDERSLLDPATAVDENGSPANLTSFTYIRVTSSILQNCGPLGEASTELGGLKLLK